MQDIPRRRQFHMRTTLGGIKFLRVHLCLCWPPGTTTEQEKSLLELALIDMEQHMLIVQMLAH